MASEYPNPSLPAAQQLFEACTALMAAKAREMLDSGRVPDVNTPRYMGHSLITHCSAISSPDIMKMLLEHGADPNLVDDEGDTALETAVWQERPDLVEVLLKAGADPAKSGRDETRLLEIAEERAPECLELLGEFIARRRARVLDEATPRSDNPRTSPRL